MHFVEAYKALYSQTEQDPSTTLRFFNGKCLCHKSFLFSLLATRF